MDRLLPAVHRHLPVARVRCRFSSGESLAGWYAWLGLGAAQEVSAVLRYVVGATAFFQGAIGVCLWMMLSDVERYRRLLAATAVIYFVAVPFFTSSTPGPGCRSGGACMMVFGASSSVLLWLSCAEDHSKTRSGADCGIASICRERKKPFAAETQSAKFYLKGISARIPKRMNRRSQRQRRQNGMEG
jgi:hypothetical protein